MSLTAKGIALAKRPLGRRELKHFTDRNDGQPAAKLKFKFYHHATNKIVDNSDEAATFLQQFF
jgi:hypothetical protein